MKIKNINLHNFRQYRDVNIDFSTDAIHNVTIILAENSTGKTTLMQAIKWCLYGEVNLANKDFLLNQDVKGSSRSKFEEIKVSLTINENDTDFEIERVRKVIVNGEKLESEDLSLKYKDNDGVTQIIEASTDRPDSAEMKKINRMINRILSKDMSDYFLFDGERIDNLGQNNTQSRKDISKAISAINEFAILDNSVNSLTNLYRRYQKDITETANDRELTKQDRTLTSTRIKIKDIEQEIEKEEEEFNALNQTIKSLDQRLQNYDTSKVLVKQRNVLEKRYENNLERLKKDEAIISEKSYQYNTNSLIFKLKEKYSSIEFNEEFNNETIPDMKADSIQFILDRGICICGEIITEEHREHLLNQQKKQPPISNATLVSGFNNLISNYTGRIDGLINDINNGIDSYDHIELQLMEITKEINEIGSKIGNLDEDGVAKLDQERNNASRRKGILEKTIINNKSELKNLQNNLERAQNAYSQAMRENKAQQFNQIKLKLVEESLVSLKDMIAGLKIERKQEIEDAANKHFRDIIYKDKKIQIDNKFDYKVIENNGTIASPSEGERTAISMSLILAIIDIHKKNSSQNSKNEASNYITPKEFSIVLDAAFATLDNQFSKSISEKLPESIEQVILFTTKKQYSGAVEDALKDRIGYLYQLDIPSDEYKNSLTNENLNVINGREEL